MRQVFCILRKGNHMSYLYETHLHTRNASACGRTDAADYIPYFLEKGYDGIFVTDHFWLGNTCIPRELPWEEWVHGYCSAYREAKEAGDRAGLKVFFGWETTYQGDDYLCYGPDEEWLIRHPDMIHWTVKEQYEHVIRAGGMVIQAHPFRERGYMNAIHLHPHECDGWEVMNAGNEPYQNVLAYHYAEDHGIRMTCGSDIHKAGSTAYGETTFGMAFSEPLNSVQDYIRLVKAGQYTMDVPEDAFFCEPKQPVFPIHYYDAEGREQPFDKEKELRF